ncbi:uncharacterized protein LOC135470711 [Liolophura sinensis]|uniref:uncharacterized protein LOC135470711 n=1 Tax=Liolophura sinensis TaxID=3198878 RepID=UPI0031584D44
MAFESVNLEADLKNCQIPEYYHGDWYSQEGGEGVTAVINQNSWGGLNCYDIRNANGSVSSDDLESRILLKDPNGECFYCHYVLYRTPNVLQYRKTTCATRSQGLAPELESLCGKRPFTEELITQYRTDPVNVNCKRTFEGVYHFSYEKQEGQGGICETQDSTIYACQLPGSPYVDNQVFYLNYGKCRDVSTSREQRIRYQCMGTWAGENGYTYAGIANTVEKDPRERFKCLLTRLDQRPADNKYRWVRSRFSDCRSLQSTYAGYERLVVSPIPPTSTYTTPACNLPRNLTGTWFTMGEADTQVNINETHIMMKQKIDEYTYRETYFSCQQTYGTRYLMTAITVGRCEVDFICWDIVPRHHSIVRYRTGRPNRLTEDEKNNPNYREIKFRQACDFLSFTIDRKKTNWKYGVLILDPPNPVPCPIAGRYRFNQNARNRSDLITTVIRGVTERPRVKVDCRNVQSEFKSCSGDMTKIEIDAEYCETVDYKGRPIGEYDEPDRILTCVGYWMEDMKSYLMTYDEEDAISNFRCWVYKRISWTEIVLSRSARATCDPRQEATSYTPDQGASLSLELSESERLFDMCPQRYDDGYYPYRKPLAIYVMAGSSHLTSYLPVIGTLLFTLFSFFLH